MTVIFRYMSSSRWPLINCPVSYKERRDEHEKRDAYLLEGETKQRATSAGSLSS